MSAPKDEALNTKLVPLTSNSGLFPNSVADAPRCSNVPTFIAATYSRRQHVQEIILKSVSSREFNQDVSQAKRFAMHGPVFVTDRGKPTHVLLAIDAYRQLLGKSETLPQQLEASEPLAADPDWRAAGPWSRKA
jgi:PHD/YefM family antitoxin component YafN of YafNO toxin-antitoxin module